MPGLSFSGFTQTPCRSEPARDSSVSVNIFVA
ncbi:hypothetical protein [Pseudomonas mandelii]